MRWFDIAEELLPPVYKAIKDMYAYAKSLNTEFLNFVSYFERILNNFFIQRCSLQTLEYWENLLDISLDGYETTEERRIKVLEYLNNIYPTSEPYVRSVIERMFPEEEYHLWFDVENNNPFNLNIDIFTTNITELNKFKEWMRKMCPAHIYQIIAKAMRTQFDRPAVINHGHFTATITNLGLVEFIIPPHTLFNIIDTVAGTDEQCTEPPDIVSIDKGGSMFTSPKTLVNIETPNNYETINKGGTMFTSNKQIVEIPIQGIDVIDNTGTAV